MGLLLHAFSYNYRPISRLGVTEMWNRMLNSIVSKWDTSKFRRVVNPIELAGSAVTAGNRY